jgi:hypothetical protein
MKNADYLTRLKTTSQHFPGELVQYSDAQRHHPSDSANCRTSRALPGGLANSSVHRHVTEDHKLGYALLMTDKRRRAIAAFRS